MTPGILSYRSVADLNAAAAAVAVSDVARRAAVIVGIPRSGLLFASLVALHGQRPLTDVGGLLRNETFSSGQRLGAGGHPPAGAALVVDDSVNSGSALSQVKCELAAAALERDIYYGAAYVSDHGATMLDVYAERIQWPRVFEWNIMHHDILADACLDMDGVLCVDPAPGLEDDDAAYRRFLTTAPPLFTPSVPIGHVVTSRLEKFRPETTAWLSAHGVDYESLVMLDLPTAAERRRLRSHASFKAGVYIHSSARLFIESEPHQAAAIASISGKPCYCVTDRAMHYPSLGSALRGSPLPTALEFFGVPRSKRYVGRQLRRVKASVGRTLTKPPR